MRYSLPSQEEDDQQRKRQIPWMVRVCHGRRDSCENASWGERILRQRSENERDRRRRSNNRVHCVEAAQFLTLILQCECVGWGGPDVGAESWRATRELADA